MIQRSQEIIKIIMNLPKIVDLTPINANNDEHIIPADFRLDSPTVIAEV